VKKLYSLLAIFLLCGSFLFAAEPTLIKISQQDKVLILAPHPDDEILGCGGLIQQAKKCGAALKIICLTDGDHNQLSFLFSHRLLIMSKKGFIRFGQARRDESKQALASLGLKEANIAFLGYPDSRLEALLVKYGSADVSRPGKSIIEDLKKIISDFKPTKVFVSHPADSNSDHAAAYVFLQVALWDLEPALGKPQVFPYLVHLWGWLKPRGYHPKLEMNPPPDSALGPLSWQKLILSGEEIEAKLKAIKYYQSQCAYARKFLFSFARKSEVFGSYPEIAAKKTSPPQESLCLTFNLRRKADISSRFSLFLLGYSREKDFSQMPKLEVSWDKDQLKIYDKKKRLSPKLIEVTWEDKKTLTLKIPLSLLAEPDYLAVKAGVNSGNILPNESKAWRIIKL